MKSILIPSVLIQKTQPFLIEFPKSGLYIILGELFTPIDLKSGAVSLNTSLEAGQIYCSVSLEIAGSIHLDAGARSVCGCHVGLALLLPPIPEGCGSLKSDLPDPHRCTIDTVSSDMVRDTCVWASQPLPTERGCRGGKENVHEHKLPLIPGDQGTLPRGI